METLDNIGRWTFDRVRQRYRKYCGDFGVEHQELEVHPYSLERGWTSGIIRTLTEKAKTGDLAAAEICIELMEEDRGLAYGRSTKSNIPRAIAKCALTDTQKRKIRRRVHEMLSKGFLPKEFRQYAWLIRRIGPGDWGPKLERNAAPDNEWAQWYVRYMLDEVPPPRPDRGSSSNYRPYKTVKVSF